MIDPTKAAQMLAQFIGPWRKALIDPAAAQSEVLERLLVNYNANDYGRSHRADQVGTVSDYRRLFPVVNYEDMKPLVRQAMEGNHSALLSEPPIAWSITRGTSGDERKFVPVTATSMQTLAAAGRAVIEYAAQGHLDVFQGVNLNLNFPSVVGKLRVGEQELEYGYSSGVYTKHVSRATPVRSLPAQEEIDALGGDRSLADWDRRFELAYDRCRGENVTLVGGVAPTAVLFGQYLWKKHRVYPKNLWKVQVMTLGSVPGINTRYRATLKGMYGDVAIREIYGATEGILGQQRDERRAWAPNYDMFFFEVMCGSEIKMLHEMKVGEYGSLIVSTPVFPRYRIGDVIVAGSSPYFRCIGRERPFTRLRYLWDSLSSFDFGRI